MTKDCLTSLPQDVETCHKIIRELFAKVEELTRDFQLVKQELMLLRRKQFGPSSERHNPGQGFLFDNMFAVVEPESKEEPQKPADKEVKGHGRRRLPKKLPRKVILHDLDDSEKTCPCCGEALTRIGENSLEQLDYTPASLYVLNHVTPQYACKHCADSKPLSKERPLLPIEKGLAGPGLLAHIAVSKYSDHLPLNRLENILSRHDVDITRSTMCDWMRQISDLLWPLYVLMREEVLASRAIHTDDTPVGLREKGRTTNRTSYVWVYLGDEQHPYTVYDFSEGRTQKTVKNFIGGKFSGYMHADAFKGYDTVYVDGKVKEVGCWSHLRRKYTDAAGSSPLVDQAVEIIGRLYGIEKAAKEKRKEFEDDEGFYEYRKKLRQEQAVPIIHVFKAWLNGNKDSVLPKSLIGKAFTYSLNQFDAMLRYTEQGYLEIDNNAAERALRQVVVGKNNWQHFGSPRGGRTAAVLYSLIMSARQNGVEPFRYMRDVIERISAHPQNELANLLPTKIYKTSEE
jgi:transposase